MWIIFHVCIMERFCGLSCGICGTDELLFADLSFFVAVCIMRYQFLDGPSWSTVLCISSL